MLGGLISVANVRIRYTHLSNQQIDVLPSEPPINTLDCMSVTLIQLIILTIVSVCFAVVATDIFQYVCLNMIILVNKFILSIINLQSYSNRSMITPHAQILKLRSIRLFSYKNHLNFQRKTKPFVIHFQL